MKSLETKKLYAMMYTVDGENLNYELDYSATVSDLEEFPFLIAEIPEYPLSSVLKQEQDLVDNGGNLSTVRDYFLVELTPKVLKKYSPTITFSLEEQLTDNKKPATVKKNKKS